MFAGFTAFTWFHTAISLIMLVAGFAMMFGMFRSEGPPRLDRAVPDNWRAHERDRIRLPVHQAAAVALHRHPLARRARDRAARALRLPSRRAVALDFVVTAMIAFYLDAFVLVTQLFLKVPAIHALAPLAPDVPQPPFAIAQGLVLLVFAYWTYKAVKGYHPAS